MDHIIPMEGEGTMSNDPEERNDSTRVSRVTTVRSPKPSNKIIHNQTARRIGVAFKEDEGLFVLPPFGKRTVTPEEAERLDYEPWKRQNLVSVDDEREKRQEDTYLTALGCLVWVFLLGIPLGLLVPVLRGSLWYWGAFVGIVVIVILVTASWGKWRLVGQWIGQSFSLILILAIGVGLPALVIYFFGGGQALLAPGQWREHPLALLGRGLQLIFIAVTSLLPALLYFLFDRQRLGTLRESFFHSIILLDPTVVTMEDARSIYGERVEEVYGPEEGARGRGRFLYGTRGPILVATLVITLGWILALLPAGPIPADLQPDDLHTLLSPRLTATIYGFLGAYFFALNMILRRYARADLKPKAYSHIAVRFLVIIVLVWALSVLPHFWNDVTAGVSGIATGIARLTQGTTSEEAPTVTAQPDVSGDEQTSAGAPAPEEEPAPVSPGEESGPSPEEASSFLLLLAFFVGIVPETGTTVIQEYLRNQKWFENRIPSLQEKLPLNALEGINLYDRARLLEEGIENIENLVHHDLIDLLLQTRIPLPRLVDWIDQGILYLHMVDALAPEPSSAEDGEKGAEPFASSLQTLRKYGIRTATDLEQACDAAEARDEKAVKNEEEAIELQRLLGVLDPPGEEVKRLRVILDALTDDEWLAHIRNWRDLSRFQDDIYVVDEERGFGIKALNYTEDPVRYSH
jgi:hypothetical protein